MMKRRKFSDLVIGIAFVVLGIVVLFLAAQLKTVKLGIGPAGFPRFIAVMMMILGAAMTLSVIISGVEKPEWKMTKQALLMFGSSVALCVLYVALLPTVGFLLLTPVLLFVMMMLFGNRKYLLCAAVSIATTAVVWLLFTKVFLIFLPVGRLFL